MGLDRFGASAPGNIALENLGFTPGNVADRARALLATGGKQGPGATTGAPPGLGGATAERSEQP